MQCYWRSQVIQDALMMRIVSPTIHALMVIVFATIGVIVALVAVGPFGHMMSVDYPSMKTFGF
jgi:hypothetical protein